MTQMFANVKNSQMTTAAAAMSACACAASFALIIRTLSNLLGVLLLSALVLCGILIRLVLIRRTPLVEQS